MKKPITVWIIISSFFIAGIALAISSSYSPGETLDPACAPGEENCTVSTGTVSFEGTLTSSMSPSVANLSDELLTDSSFENWNVQPVGWDDDGASDSVEFVSLGRSSEAHGGDWSAFYEPDPVADYNYTFYVSETTTLVADAEVSIKLWAKGGGTHGVALARTGEPDDTCYHFTGDVGWGTCDGGEDEGPHPDIFYVSAALTDEWTEYEIPVITIPEAGEYFVAVETESLENVYFDDISLRTSAVGDNLISNGDFEAWEGGHLVPDGWSSYVDFDNSDNNMELVIPDFALDESTWAQLPYESLGEGDYNSIGLMQVFSGLTPGDSYTLNFAGRESYVNAGINVIYKYIESVEIGENNEYFYNFSGPDSGTWTSEDWPGSENIQTLDLDPDGTQVTGRAVMVPAGGEFIMILTPNLGTIEIDNVQLLKDNSGPDIVVGGAFESWHGQYALDDWLGSGFDPGDYYIEEESTLVHSGNSSVKLVSGTYGESSLVLQTITGLTPGNEFEFSYYALAGNSNIVGHYLIDHTVDAHDESIYFFSGENAGTWVSADLVEGADTADFVPTQEISGVWAQYSTSGIPVPDSGVVSVAVFNYGLSGAERGTVYVDDFSFREYTSEPVEYISFLNQQDFLDLNNLDKIFTFKSGDDHDYFSQNGDGSFDTDATQFDFSSKAVAVGTPSAASDAANLTYIQENTISKLGVLQDVDLTGIGTYDLYDIPAGKKLFVDKIILNVTAADGVDLSQCGWDGDCLIVTLGTSEPSYDDLISRFSGGNIPSQANNANFYYNFFYNNSDFTKFYTRSGPTTLKAVVSDPSVGTTHVGNISLWGWLE